VNDKPAASEIVVFDPARAGWKIVKPIGFGELVGPIWRQGDARFGFVVEQKHLNFADIVHGGMLTTLADHARLRQQTARHDRAECSICRRGAARRIRRGALRSGPANARHHLYAMQARGWHACGGERNGDLEDKRRGVKVFPSP
jgi:hypothetical protein